MPVALSAIKKVKENRSFSMTATVTLSGTYPALGEPLDLSSYMPLASARQPDKVSVDGKAGFVYQYDPVNKKLLVYTNTAGGANAALGEHTAITYVVGVSGDSISLKAEWLFNTGN